MTGLTLDAGALIALERRQRSLIALLAAADKSSRSVTIPATVLAQVIRDPQRQVVLTRLLRTSSTSVVSLDHPASTAVGRLLAASGTSDIADAHVVVAARERGDTIITGDPDDLHHLTATGESVKIVAI